MLQHVSIEVPLADVGRTVEFFGLMGFAEITPPGPLQGNVSWLEREGTQVHLIHTDHATVPVLGHCAVVAPDFSATCEALSGAGFEVAETRELWGEPRAFAVGPAGHRVELMAAPPPST